MTINEKTKVSLYAIACSIPFLVSTVLWFSSINQKAEAAQAVNFDQERRLEKHDRMIEDQTNLLMNIRERLIRIETLLKTQK